MHKFKPIQALHQRSGLTNQFLIATEETFTLDVRKWGSKASDRDKQNRKQLDSSEISSNQKEPYQLSGNKMPLQFQYYNLESLKCVPDLPVSKCYYRKEATTSPQKSSQNKSYENFVS